MKILIVSEFCNYSQLHSKIFLNPYLHKKIIIEEAYIDELSEIKKSIQKKIFTIIFDFYSNDKVPTKQQLSRINSVLRLKENILK